jgi:type 2 lantibiotic biosynthesis protein LanM
VEQAIAAAAAPDTLPALDTWQDAFAVPFGSFLSQARDQVTTQAQHYLTPMQVDLAAVAQTLTAALGRQLARLAARTMVHELDVAREDGQLTGLNGRQRFADFIERQSEPAHLAALFEQYPVLARLLGMASTLATKAWLELLTRFALDRTEVIESLLGGVEPGPVIGIDPSQGDQHRQGRSVAILSFADGRKVVYKPRSLAAHALFGEVAEWLNERLPRAGLRTVSALARPEYGWLEFIAPRPLSQPGQAADFYRREGVLLAALYALHATDMHEENILACGDQPVLIDVETLFHPVLPAPHTTSEDPAALALGTSVHSTALLPWVSIGDNGMRDRSGMGGELGGISPDGVLDWDPPATDRAQLVWRADGPPPDPRNRPVYDGEVIEPADHERDVLEGFRLGYDAIAAERSCFRNLVEFHADLDVRAVIRPSRGYARLLDESTHPALLRDAKDRDEALDLLHEVSVSHPLWRQMVEHELIDMWAGDIPLVTCRPWARSVWTSAGVRLPGLIARPGLRCALDTIAGMGEIDRRDQEWIISASLATRDKAGDGGHGASVPAQHPAAAVAADPDRLLAAASGLADEIIARSVAGPGQPDRSRVNWLGLQSVEGSQWMVLPMGAGLADGYLGVALFLAQLGSLTGIGRYAEIARRAAGALPRLLDVLASRIDLISAVGCGVNGGLGGISYGLARLATLLGDREIADWAEAAVGLAATAAELPGPPGWADGIAGCLAAMTAVHFELNCAAADTLARECADRLAGLAERTNGRCGTNEEEAPGGFAAGPAGIGFALARYATSARQDHNRAAHRALRRGSEPLAAVNGQMSRGWCLGAAGLLVARACLTGHEATEDAAGGELRAAAARLAARDLSRDLSLCHGELGIADALITLASYDEPVVGPRALRREAGLALQAVTQQPLLCGTPGGVPTPGLLSGLAGVGYGLLRLAQSAHVPSVLLMEPTPPRPAGNLPR